MLGLWQWACVSAQSNDEFSLDKQAEQRLPLTLAPALTSLGGFEQQLFSP